MTEFEKFKQTVREAEANGEIKTTAPLTDCDLAVQWAVAKVGDRKGYPCTITLDEIWQEMYSIRDQIKL